MATTYDYDLSVLDLMLPALSGTEVLRQIRSANHRVPILMLTARDAVADKVEHLEAGADDYLTKPFAFAELMARIKALLRRGSVERPSVLRVADLEVDRLSQQVRRASRRIELTAKEYALLEYLIANAGRVGSRRLIRDHVSAQSLGGDLMACSIKHICSVDLLY